jgi:hypothetical protein
MLLVGKGAERLTRAVVRAGRACFGEKKENVKSATVASSAAWE